MDHMDGITALFEAFNPLNFWDSDNTKEMPSSAWDSSPYSKEDWEFYKRLRDAKPQDDPSDLPCYLEPVGSSGTSGRMVLVEGTVCMSWPQRRT